MLEASDLKRMVKVSFHESLYEDVEEKNENCTRKIGNEGTKNQYLLIELTTIACMSDSRVRSRDLCFLIKRTLNTRRQIDRWL